MSARKTVQPGNKVEIIKKPGGIGIIMPGRPQPTRPGHGGPTRPGHGGPTRPIGGC